MRRARYVLVLALAVCTAVMFTPVAARAAQPGMAWLRQLYPSSDSPNVDLYVDGTRTWSNVPYKTISKYVDLKPGSHTYVVRPAGAAPDSPATGQVQANLLADTYYSVVVAGKFQNMNLSIYPDSPGPNPAPDHCMARFLHATPDVPKVDVVLNGSTFLYKNISFMEASPYLQMPSGSYDVELRAAGSSTAIFTIKGFMAEGGHIYTLAAAGGVGRPVELVEMYDSTSVAVTPVGGAATGAGGTALRQLSQTPLGLTVLAIGAAAVVLLARRRRTTA
jgi:Domain of unknown function (DUF4397)